MSGDRGQPFVSVLANMNDEDYRKKMAQQQALENVYPEAIVAPLGRSAVKTIDAIVVPQTTKITTPTIGSNLPTEEWQKKLAETAWAHVGRPSQEELLKRARDKYIESGKRAIVRELEDSTEAALKRSTGEFGAYVNEDINKYQKELKQKELRQKELRERKYGTN